LVGLTLFVALGAIDDGRFWSETWFFAGLGVFLSATFVEPFFSRPQDAIVNAVGGITIFVGAQRDPIEGLWLTFVAAMVVLVVAGVWASLTIEGSGRLKWPAFRVASALGRANIVGTTALLLIVLTEAANGEQGFEWLAAGTGVLMAALGINWAGVLGGTRRTIGAATAVAAVGPRMLLVATGGKPSLEPGDAVEVEGRDQAEGVVIARLPHKDGVRYQLALDREWTSIAPTFPGELVVRASDQISKVVGAAAEGSTDLRLEFEPLGAVSVGQPVALHVDGEVLLYQVSRLGLVSSSWAGAAAVVPHASAHVVGWPQPDGFIRAGGHLPRPHDLIHRVDGVGGALPDGFYEIGHLKGTTIPVGMRIDTARRGHMAVLGMSGMGKTAVAQRICKALGESNVVVALDTTGEYAGRLGVPLFADDFDAHGFVVHEPAGDPPQQAAAFVMRCMEAGVAEYRATQGEVQARVVLLEEAHTFVPEWNVALRHQQEPVGYITRMIMQARKFGITFVIVSQRTAVVSKSALSQCENYIVLKTIDQTSLEYLETVVGKDMRSAIAGLGRYEAVCVGPAFNAQEPVIVELAAP
jgi:hypothetical protein